MPSVKRRASKLLNEYGAAQSAGQEEMLLPISGKRAAKAEARGLESPEMSMTGGYRNETKK